MISLRDYQQDTLTEVQKARQEGLTRLLAVLPTGCGKTIIFSELARPGGQRLWRKWKMSKMKKAEASVIEVFEKNEQFGTASLDVAEKFGKRHDGIVQAIKNLKCSATFTLLNFQESTRLLEPIRNLERPEEFKWPDFRPLFRTFCFAARGEGVNGEVHCQQKVMVANR